MSSGDRPRSRDELLDGIYRRGRRLRWRHRVGRGMLAAAAVAVVAIPVFSAVRASPDKSKVDVVGTPSTSTTAAVESTSASTATTSVVPTTSTPTAPSISTSTSTTSPASATTTTGPPHSVPSNQPLTITVRHQPDVPTSGQAVAFKATADDPDASIQCIAIEYGDGSGAPCVPPQCDINPSWGPVPGHNDHIEQHVFDAPGTYTVRVTAYSGPCQSQFASSGETQLVITVN